MKGRKLPTLTPPAQKVQAATRRAARHATHDGHDEPNMKLSHAFIVVLVLHVVAVGGIYAFNSIKTQRERAHEFQAPQMAKKFDSAPSAPATRQVQQQTSAPVEKPKAVEKPKVAATPQPKPVEKTVAKSEEKAPVAKQEKLPKDSGKLYTVVKGDNPVSIAKKLKVDYEALLQLNHIDDPRRLQIGQKLRIPVKNGGA